MDEPKAQRGFLLIVAVILIAVAAAMAAVIVTMTAGSGQAGGAHVNSTDALYLAQSGLERANNQLASGTTCTALNNNVALGRGTYVTTGQTFSVTAGVTVSVVINNVVTVIPVSTIATLAGHGRVRINNEEIDYASTSTSAAVCGTAPCLVGARRGTAGTVAAAQAALSLVRQSLCLIRSTGTVNNSVRVLERTLHPPVTMMAYSKLTTDRNIYYRIWDPTIPGWGAEATANQVTNNFSANFLVLRMARTRNEAILATYENSFGTATSGNIMIQVWNGFSWTVPAGGNPMIYVQPGALADTYYKVVDIAYETLSDRAIIVSDNGAYPDYPSYNIWNGTTLVAGGQTAITGYATPPEWTRWVDLAANPNSNEIAMIGIYSRTTGGVIQYVQGQVWTGAAWAATGLSWDTPANGTPVTGCNAPCVYVPHSSDVAYEQNSRIPHFIWGSGTTASRMFERTWNGAAFSAANVTAFNVTGGNGEWLRLTSQTNSNDIYAAAQTSTSRIDTSRLTGGAWGAVTNHTAAAQSRQDRTFDILYEGDLNSLSNAVFVWGDSGTANARRRRWDGTAVTWGAISTSGANTALINMASHYASGQVFSGVYASNAAAAASRTITGLNWTSGTTTWAVPTPNPIWAGSTVADPVNERVTVQARRPIFIEEQEVFP